MTDPVAPATEEITLRAHAKLNVFLRVLGRRADGFHDLESLMLPLELHDLVTVRRADGLRLDLSGPASAGVPPDGANLVLAAAQALLDASSLNGAGADIALDKRIPVAAGLGGGSADAAATLHALNALWGCGLDPAELGGIGAGVGSDVPALLANEPVFVTGRGEHVHPVHVPVTWWVVKPFGFEVRTQDAFSWWDVDPVTGPDTGVLTAAAETGNDELLGSALFNDLQSPVTARHPRILDAIAAFLQAGALGAVMTGSGPTVVALASHLPHANRLAEAVPGSVVTSGPPAPVHPVPAAG
jgi:4-diphosphocytidyl-2-C-methyl-D-erythritol kinase